MTIRTPALLASALAAVAIGATACSSGPVDGQPVIDSETLPPATVQLDPGDIVLTAGLQTVSSCDDLLARIKAEALDRVGPYGFGGQYGGPLFATDMVVPGATIAAQGSEGGAAGLAPPTAAPVVPAAGGEAVASAQRAGAPALADQAGAGAAAETSGTNNQEAGVDEADLVKTDGKRLVVVSGRELRVIDTTGGATPELAKVITLPDSIAGGELFLAGDTALVMTTGWTNRPYVDDGARTDPSDWFPGSPTARLIEVDLAHGDVTRILELEGSYLSAREVDGTVRIVVSANAERFAFVYPSNQQAEDAAEKANRALIEESTIDQWLPTYQVVEGDVTIHSGPMVDCERTYLPQDFAGFGSLVLLTVDPAQGLDLVDTTAVLTDAQTVYASTDLVAVATPRWPTYDERGAIVDDGTAYTTAVHTFDITDPTEATYVASGTVPGHLLNQYSLSEHDGYLRVATTAGSPWGGGGPQSESMITVLGLDGEALVTAGEVRGLGKGEQIQAVRFLGDKGYVVTFRQTDPLYVVDLADPARPRPAGELKIPGFSSYLHPVDEGHLLGVGTDGNDQGATFGTVVSLFDVTNPADPARSAKLSIGPESEGTGDGFGNVGSWTPVASDARAFTWWEDTAVVPVSWYRFDPHTGQQSNGSDAVVVAVDAASGELTEVGRVTQPATQACKPGVPVPMPIEGDGGIGGPATGADVATTTAIPAPIVASGPIVSGGGSTGVITPPPDYCYTVPADIYRTVVIGDELYTVSTAGVGVHRFHGSLSEVAWIPFT
ncbi:MAG: beta-propeller domain-containing protein [Acidimicrobiia bacterium]|nr:beta-propeller domain-containing protein [Acidimicrobiia bacterium]